MHLLAAILLLCSAAQLVIATKDYHYDIENGNPILLFRQQYLTQLV